MHYYLTSFNRIHCLLFSLTVLFLPVLHAETITEGDISGKTFGPEGNPYVVGQDLLIPEGKKAVIKEGCVFLFKPFTGLNVYGDFSVEGTQEHPVTFTSINDDEYTTDGKQLPNPFDWNGIFVSKESGNVSLKHFNLRFSVYGIKSHNTHLVLDNGQFRQNGQFHFTINDKMQYVHDNFPFSFNIGESSAASVTPRRETVPKETVPVPHRQGTSGSRSVFVNKGVPAIIAGTGVASGVVSLLLLSKWVDMRRDYRKEPDPDKAVEIKHDAKQPSYAAIGTGVVSLTAIASGAALYWWWNLREVKPVTITPVLQPDRAGAMLTITLRE